MPKAAKKTKKAAKKFNKVVFLFPIEEGFFLNDDEPKNPNILFVGDGKTPVTLADILSIKGKVTDDVEIIISAHGANKISPKLSKKIHFLQTNPDFSSTETRLIFETLASAIGTDSHATIKLVACDGATSLEDAKEVLPRTVTTYGFRGDLASSGVYDRFLTPKDSSTDETKLKLLIESPAILSFLENGEIFKSAIPSAILPNLNTRYHIISQCEKLGITCDMETITEKVAHVYNCHLIHTLASYYLDKNPEKHAALLENIKSSGVDVNADTNPFAPSLLSPVEKEDILLVKTVISMGGKVNRLNADGTSPLYLAAKENYQATVKALLAAEADPNLATFDGENPLTISAQQNNHEMIEILVNAPGIKIDQGKPDGTNALMIAINENNETMVATLLSKGANPNHTMADGNTALHLAAQNSSKQIVKALIKKGADVTLTKPPYDSTPLHMAAQTGNMDAAKVLLENGANINQGRRNGLTPLGLAIHKGHEKLVEFLISKNARTDNVVEGKGMGNVLDIAASTPNQNPKIIALLLRKVDKDMRQDFIDKKNSFAAPVKAVIEDYQKEVQQRKLETETAKKAKADSGITKKPTAIKPPVLPNKKKGKDTSITPSPYFSSSPLLSSKTLGGGAPLINSATPSPSPITTRDLVTSGVQAASNNIQLLQMLISSLYAEKYAVEHCPTGPLTYEDYLTELAQKEVTPLSTKEVKALTVENLQRQADKLERSGRAAKVKMDKAKTKNTGR